MSAKLFRDVIVIYLGRWLRKTLEHTRTAKIQASLRIRTVVQDLPCSPTQYIGTLLKIGLIPKILTRGVAVQTGLGLRQSYACMPLGPLCQPAAHL